MFLLIESYSFNCFRRTKALIQLCAPADIMEFDLQVSTSFAGLGMLDFDRAPQATLMLDYHTGTYSVAVDFH